MKRKVVFSILVLMSIFFLFSDENTDFEIPQNIGGELVIEGDRWADIHSYGDIYEIQYRATKDKKLFYVGNSDYYGRFFDKNKQIIFKNGNYLLSVGDRLNGDKILASKDLKIWKEFQFDKESILKLIENDQFIYQENLINKIFVEDLKNNLAEWKRKGIVMLHIGNPGNQRNADQLVRFSYLLDWKKQKLICTEILEKKEIL